MRALYQHAEYESVEVTLGIDGEWYPVLECSSHGIRFRCLSLEVGGWPFEVGDWLFATLSIGKSVPIMTVIEVVDVDWWLCAGMFKSVSGRGKKILEAMDSSDSYFSVLIKQKTFNPS